MEHRLGNRVSTDQPVLLDGGPYKAALGRLRNVSLSGGYVETAARILFGTRLHMYFEWALEDRPVRCRISAYVVRTDEHGVGVEWSNLRPRPIRKLLTAASAPDLKDACAPACRAPAGA